jgi:hypothetical protein
MVAGLVVHHLRHQLEILMLNSLWTPGSSRADAAANNDDNVNDNDSDIDFAADDHGDEDDEDAGS